MLYMAFGYTFYDFLTIFRYAAKFTIYVFMNWIQFRLEIYNYLELTTQYTYKYALYTFMPITVENDFII